MLIQIWQKKTHNTLQLIWYLSEFSNAKQKNIRGDNERIIWGEGIKQMEIEHMVSFLIHLSGKERYMSFFSGAGLLVLVEVLRIKT